MRITRLRTNHLINPLGFQMDQAILSYVVEGSKGKRQEAAQVTVAKDPDFANILYDSGPEASIDGICFPLPLSLQACTRYFWKVKVRSDAGEEAESETAWFETAKAMGAEWTGHFITQTFSQKERPVFQKEFTVTRPVRQARLYGVGLGVYELYINGIIAGDEALLPGIHAYDSWLQYQTFELELKEGVNLIEAALGDGWYKGPYGLKEKLPRHGSEHAFIAEIQIQYMDGTKEVLGTDESWSVKKGKVIFDSIYDGEIFDERVDSRERFPVKRADLDTRRLAPRLSPKISIHERIKPVAVLKTPAWETVLDMGQNMVGWLEFRVHQPRDSVVRLAFGEILQEGDFYRDNLRTAKCEYTYISDGMPQVARAHFTFYGFRYVKLEGWKGEINPEDFTGCVVHSQMEETGTITTSNELVNRLFSNVRWGQKGNFLDTPTDCPQRDERMGWTGDAQIFADTASYNMDTYAFYVKFMKDLAYEQEKCGGSVPYVVPMSRYELNGASVWGDAATVIPWTTYLHFGDQTILEKQYPSMKAWVDYIKQADERTGGRRLWKSGRHFGDWLALDGKVDGGVYGSTDKYFVATAYYYYSALLTAKTAGVLQKKEEQLVYQKLADEVKAAFLDEYLTKTGRLSVDTQTGYALAFYMDLIPAGVKERVSFDFKEKLKENAFRLNTGFVGTPYLCPALTENGFNELAYDLLINEEYPGWLYAVKLGATTIWERWNSVYADGSISTTGMNSLNHYAYGSIAGWMYRYMIGIQPLEEAPGFKKAQIAPKPSYHLKQAEGEVKTSAGTYRVGWKLPEAARLEIKIEIPFDTTAKVVLPRAAGAVIETDAAEDICWRGQGADAYAELSAGRYCFTYRPAVAYQRRFGMDSNFKELMGMKKTRDIIIKYFPNAAGGIPFQGEGMVLEEIAKSPFGEVSDEDLQKMKEELENLSDD